MLSGGVTEDSVDVFVERAISHGSEQVIRTDAYSSLNVIAKKRIQQKKVTPPEEAANHAAQRGERFISSSSFMRSPRWCVSYKDVCPFPPSPAFFRH